MITTQTFDIQDNRDELEVISSALWLIGEKRYSEACSVLIARHDKLTAYPKLKIYDQREHRA
jgi:hypothetical protein